MAHAARPSPPSADIVRLHAKVAGRTACGAQYSAADPRLLCWVQATAAYGFAQAYSRYVDPLSRIEFDALYREGAPAARLYGALDAPTSAAELTALFDSMRGRLEPSPVIFEFLEIMRNAPLLPRSLRWVQRMLVRAAVEIIPDWLRERLALGRTLWFASMGTMHRATGRNCVGTDRLIARPRGASVRSTWTAGRSSLRKSRIRSHALRMRSATANSGLKFASCRAGAARPRD